MTASFTRLCTEEEYLALPETKPKAELFDGYLVEQATPTYRHQDLAVELRNALWNAARAAGLWIYIDTSIRLGAGRIAAPDLMIRPRVLDDVWLTESAPVRLVCEITSTNKKADTVDKMRFYAEAGIPWYLIVEPAEPTLFLYRLDGGEYAEEAMAKPGQVLRFTEPIHTELDPAALLRE